MSNIEWTEETWNPIAGCSVHTPGCTNCYAMKMAARLEAIALADVQLRDTGRLDHYIGLTQPSKAGPVWTGRIGIALDTTLTKPLRWKKPRRIFVNSMSDLFHPGVPDEVIDRVFAVMALCPQHTFQLLTKRSARMREYMTGLTRAAEICPKAVLTIPQVGREVMIATVDWPLRNVHLGVSVEDQTRADQRIPDLLATPAAVRFISAEPLLGPLDLNELGLRSECRHENAYVEDDTNATICRECEEEVLPTGSSAAVRAARMPARCTPIGHAACAINAPPPALPSTSSNGASGRRRLGQSMAGRTHDGFPA